MAATSTLRISAARIAKGRDSKVPYGISKNKMTELDAENEKQRQNECESPDLTLRMLGLVPILYGAYLLCVVQWQITPQFESTLKEMDVGKLPWRTDLFLMFFNYGGVFVAGALLAGASVLYWKKASRTATGLVLFNTVSFIVCQQAYWFAMNALFDPWIEVMKQLGK